MSPSVIYDLVSVPTHQTQLSEVAIPGSKSSTLRVLLLSAMSPHPTHIHNALRSEDTEVLFRVLDQLGASIQPAQSPNSFIVSGPLSFSTTPQTFHLGESGLSLRLVLVHLALYGQGPSYLVGQRRLMARPIEGLINALRQLGVSINSKGEGIEIIPKPLPPVPIEIALDPSRSSQGVSALALALARHPYGGTLKFTQPLTSSSYLDLTSHWLSIFACTQHIQSNQWNIPGGIASPSTCSIEGDWSSAAVFILASATLGIPLKIKGLQEKTLQGDEALLSILSQVSVLHQWINGDLHLSGKMKGGFRANLSSCPDLAPVLAAASVFATEPSYLQGLQTLPYKESDRLQKIKELIHWLGGRFEVINEYELIIYPCLSVQRPREPFDPDCDHRMAFAAALGALHTGGSLLHHTCVNKTLPEFWKLWNQMVGVPPLQP